MIPVFYLLNVLSLILASHLIHERFGCLVAIVIIFNLLSSQFHHLMTTIHRLLEVVSDVDVRLSFLIEKCHVQLFFNLDTFPLFYLRDLNIFLLDQPSLFYFVFVIPFCFSLPPFCFLLLHIISSEDDYCYNFYLSPIPPLHSMNSMDSMNSHSPY